MSNLILTVLNNNTQDIFLFPRTTDDEDEDDNKDDATRVDKS